MNYTWQMIKCLLFVLPLRSANTVAQGTLDLEKHLSTY